MPAILLWFLGPIGRYVGIGIVAVSLIGGVYAKGRYDGKTAYRAKLEREIKTAISKGDAAREQALRKFDSNKEIEDDGNARD